MEFNELGKRTYENVRVTFGYEFPKIVIDKDYIKSNPNLTENELILTYIIEHLLSDINPNLLEPLNVKHSEPWVEIEVHTKKPQNY